MLTVVCFKWTPLPGYRSKYGPETVNTLRRMVARCYPHPHDFVCVTDDAAGIDPEVRIVPLWSDFADVPNHSGPKHPSCYRRLKLFASEMADVIGPRFVALDLDCVLTADVSSLWNRPEEFVIWGKTHYSTFYNGSMMLMTAGARAQVWTSFDPQRSPAAAAAAGHFGSDQAWISHCLGPNEARWSHRDGVYSYRNDLRRRPSALPATARIVLFHGRLDPWSPGVAALPWVKVNYC